MNNNSNFTEGNILKKLILFMLPVLGALVLQSMYGAVDIFVVGRFGTTEGISAISTGSSIVNLVICTVTAFSMGITVLIGSYIGAKKTEKIRTVIGCAVCVFLIISVVLSLSMILFANTFAVWMKAPTEALEKTAQYIRICGGGMIFIVAYNVISSIFRGLGNSRLPLIFVAIACVINIAGDILLVKVFDMDVTGAAIATVFAQAVSVILSFVILKKQDLPFELKLTDIRFNPEIRRFVGLGAPIGIQEFCTNLSFMILCAFANNLGLEKSSGYGIGFKITAFMMLIPSSIIQSMSAFIAQNVGAKKEDRAKKAMFSGMGIGLVIGVFVILLTVNYGDVLSMIFTKDPAVITNSYEFLLGFMADVMLTSIMFSFAGYFNGHGKTLFVMIQGIIPTLLVRLPVAYYMCNQPDSSLTGIGLAFPSATVVGIVFCTVYYIIYTKSLKNSKITL